MIFRGSVSSKYGRKRGSSQYELGLDGGSNLLELIPPPVTPPLPPFAELDEADAGARGEKIDLIRSKLKVRREE